SYFANKLTAPFFSIYPSVSPPLGVRWAPDATLRFAPLTQHVLPQTPNPIPPRRITSIVRSLIFPINTALPF
ncbi:MAG: hypothetical protein RR373_08435, partial [Akkermansia sp.]